MSDILDEEIRLEEMYNKGYDKGRAEAIKDEIEFLEKIHNYCLGTSAMVGISILDDFDKPILKRIKHLQEQIK